MAYQCHLPMVLIDSSFYWNPLSFLVEVNAISEEDDYEGDKENEDSPDEGEVKTS